MKTPAHAASVETSEEEELQERDATRLEKLILMYSIIAVRILCITYLARQTPEITCEEMLFEENE